MAFENWCNQNGRACLRTVDLFWAFEYHRNGFPRRLDVAPIKKNWLEQRKQRRQASQKIKQGRILHFDIDLKKLRPAELRRYIDRWYPDPGPWSAYYAERRAYFLEELRRYRKVLQKTLVQRMVDAHFRTVHMREDASQAAMQVVREATEGE